MQSTSTRKSTNTKESQHGGGGGNYPREENRGDRIANSELMKRNNIYSKRVAALLKVAIGVCFGTNSTFRATNETAVARAAAAAPLPAVGRGGAGGGSQDHSPRTIFHV